MPIYRRHFEPGQLQFITTSTYRRNRLFTCQRFCWIFVETLRQLRQETGFLVIGWVLMPSHGAACLKFVLRDETQGYARSDAPAGRWATRSDSVEPVSGP
jgi:hypothetical protein